MKDTYYHLGIPQNKKICLLADLHNQEYEWVLRSIRKNRPDLILYAGDIVNRYKTDGYSSILEKSPNSVALLKGCAQLAPTFFSLGNHECFITPEDKDTLSGYGIHVLDNSWENYEGFVIGGLTSRRVMGYRYYSAHKEEFPEFTQDYFLNHRREIYEMYAHDFSWLDAFTGESGYHILLCHHPEYWAKQEPYLKNQPIELVVSGHAHGGQFRFYDPFRRKWQGVLSPNQGFFPEYTEGVFENGMNHLVVTRGLANSISPIPRLFNEREVVYID